MSVLKTAYYRLRTRFAPDEGRGEPSSGAWQEAVREKAASLTTPLQPARLLEIGCGEGLFLKRFLGRSAAPALTAGIDRSCEQLNRAAGRLQAQTRGTSALLRADALKLPFADSSFDTVVCLNVLMNLPAQEKAAALIAEAARVLRPGGRFLFDIRNRRNLLIRIKYRLAPYYDGTIDRAHLRAYDQNEIKSALRGAGLTLARLHPLGFPATAAAPILLFETEKK